MSLKIRTNENSLYSDKIISLKKGGSTDYERRLSIRKRSVYKTRSPGKSPKRSHKRSPGRTPTKESPKMTVSKEQLKLIFDEKIKTNITFMDNNLYKKSYLETFLENISPTLLKTYNILFKLVFCVFIIPIIGKITGELTSNLNDIVKSILIVSLKKA